jgi:hypothetical protein
MTYHYFLQMAKLVYHKGVNKATQCARKCVEWIRECSLCSKQGSGWATASAVTMCLHVGGNAWVPNRPVSDLGLRSLTVCDSTVQVFCTF